MVVAHLVGAKQAMLIALKRRSCECGIAQRKPDLPDLTLAETPLPVPYQMPCVRVGYAHSPVTTIVNVLDATRTDTA